MLNFSAVRKQLVVTKKYCLYKFCILQNKLIASCFYAVTKGLKQKRKRYFIYDSMNSTAFCQCVLVFVHTRYAFTSSTI